jgi:hypothetical protein
VVDIPRMGEPKKGKILDSEWGKKSTVLAVREFVVDIPRTGEPKKGTRSWILHVVQNLRVLAVREFVVDIPRMGEPKKSSDPFAAATPPCPDNKYHTKQESRHLKKTTNKTGKGWIVSLLFLSLPSCRRPGI